MYFVVHALIWSFSTEESIGKPRRELSVSIIIKESTVDSQSLIGNGKPLGRCRKGIHK